MIKKLFKFFILIYLTGFYTLWHLLLCHSLVRSAFMATKVSYPKVVNYTANVDAIFYTDEWIATQQR